MMILHTAWRQFGPWLLLLQISAGFLAISIIHEIAVLRGFEPAAEILLAPEFILYLTVQISFALAGGVFAARLILLPSRLLVDIIRDAVPEWRYFEYRIVRWCGYVFLILVYLFFVSLLYVGMGGIWKFITVIFTRIAFVLILTGLMFFIILLMDWCIPCFRKWGMGNIEKYAALRRKYANSGRELKMTLSLVLIYVSTLVALLGDARADFMLDWNPVVRAEQTDDIKRDYRLIVRAAGLVVLVDNDCKLHYVPTDEVRRITEMPELRGDWKKCSDEV